MACIFCDIVAKRAPATIVHEDDAIMAFKDIHPQAPIHVLVIPKLHIASVNDLEEQHVPLMGQLFMVAKHLAAQWHIVPQGYRLRLHVGRGGGQLIDHIHMHLLSGRNVWARLSVYQLPGLSHAAWQDLCSTLIALHAAAYDWHADQGDLVPRLTTRLTTLPLHDPRLTFKALVDGLDQVQQQTFFAQGAGVGPWAQETSTLAVHTGDVRVDFVSPGWRSGTDWTAWTAPRACRILCLCWQCVRPRWCMRAHRPPL